MKTTAFFLGFVLIGMLGHAQVKTFTPKVMNYPDLSDEAVATFNKDKKAYEDLIAAGIEYKNMNADQQALFEREMEFYQGPFISEAPGCSWYCAGSPKDNFEASSSLSSSKVSNYQPKNIHDFSLKTAWVEGKEDYGINESIDINFALGDQLKITHLEIYNGYCKSEGTWKANSRVKKLSLYVNDALVGHLMLEDTYKCQRFDIGEYGGEVNFKFQIAEVYKGDKYADTAISEINFDGTGDH